MGFTIEKNSGKILLSNDGDTEMTTTTMIIGLIVSHLVVAYVAFQYGGLAAAQLLEKEINKLGKKN